MKAARLLLAVLCGLSVASAALAADGDRAGAKAGGHAGTPAEATGQSEAGTGRGDQVDLQRFGSKTPDPAFGAFQRGLYITALNLALPRADAGDPAAQALAAEIYARGLGVPRNAAKAAELYAKAATAGVPEAQFQYALMLIDGKLAARDREAAFKLMQAAAEAGNRLAQFNFAQMLIEREPGERGLDRARPYYRKAADAGLADAQYAMAQIVGGGETGDAEARRWLTLAARQNFDTAQLDLATWLVEGRGGARDFNAGFGWMKRAAESGNVAARNRLAKLYMHGLGTEPDSILAAAWYITARRAGLRDFEMDDFLQGLTVEEQKQAIERANRLR